MREARLWPHGRAASAASAADAGGFVVETADGTRSPGQSPEGGMAVASWPGPPDPAPATAPAALKAPGP